MVVTAGHINVGKLLSSLSALGLEATVRDTSPVMSDIIMWKTESFYG